MAQAPRHELASGEFHRLAVEHSRELIAAIEPDGTIVFATPSVETLLGYTPDEFVGTHVTDHVHPADLPAVRAAIEQALAGGRPYLAQLRVRRRDGETILVEATGTAVVDDEGRPWLIIGSTRRLG